MLYADLTKTSEIYAFRWGNSSFLAVLPSAPNSEVKIKQTVKIHITVFAAALIQWFSSWSCQQTDEEADRHWHDECHGDPCEEKSAKAQKNPRVLLPPWQIFRTITCRLSGHCFQESILEWETNVLKRQTSSFGCVGRVNFHVVCLTSAAKPDWEGLDCDRGGRG